MPGGTGSIWLAWYTQPPPSTAHENTELEETARDCPDLMLGLPERVHAQDISQELHCAGPVPDFEDVVQSPERHGTSRTLHGSDKRTEAAEFPLRSSRRREVSKELLQQQRRWDHAVDPSTRTPSRDYGP
jgi:hypothetical protein